VVVRQLIVHFSMDKMPNYRSCTYKTFWMELRHNENLTVSLFLCVSFMAVQEKVLVLISSQKMQRYTCVKYEVSAV